ncbi:hypothetical protein CVT24_008542 [Panaeolus cyanescens]|uniref:Uncharacterized protein n=1 Tax=Panaeolus cyanescens TaxID=181874 RepID=A0A409VL02_9AGAR|nr:hypothetical protein CVT24_008542 [Panaeolus cyanescens]
MMKTTIERRLLPEGAHSNASDSASFDVETHSYPFANFPQIRSHIHPRYVILASWAGLDKIPDQEAALMDMDVANGRILKLQRTYRHWLSRARILPGCARLDATFVGPNGEAAMGTEGGDGDGDEQKEEEEGYETDHVRMFPMPPLCERQCAMRNEDSASDSE